MNTDDEYDALLENMLRLNELLVFQDHEDEQSLLKNLNRTNSNTSCNSTYSSGLDSGFLSSHDSINCLTSNPPNKTVTYGYFGKAKTSQQEDDMSTLFRHLIVDSSRSLIDHVNHGDDVAFALKKTLQLDQETEENFFYFGLADGVSANRQRGYDAKLFPNALLHSCADYIATNHNLDSDEFENDDFLAQNQASLTIYQDEQDINEEVFDEDAEFNDDDYDSEIGVVLKEIDELNSNNSNDSSQTGFDSLTVSSDCKYLYKALSSAHTHVIDQKVYGSSTVCLMALKFLKNSQNDETRALLSTCNIGDSGYMIIRSKQVIFKSSTQTHRFNAPFQLGCTPPELLDHDLYRDKPEDSVCLTHEIKSGDLILLSSDGLFDNLYEDEIALIIDNHIKSSMVQIEANDAENASYSNLITNDLLSTACEQLVLKASKAGIKRDDMLILLYYVN